MNLRGVYVPKDSAGGSFHASRFSDIRFANSIVGNLGAPLGFEEEEHRSLADRPEAEDIRVVNISDNPLMEHFPSASSDALEATPKKKQSAVDDGKHVHDGP